MIYKDNLQIWRQEDAIWNIKIKREIVEINWEILITENEIVTIILVTSEK